MEKKDLDWSNLGFGYVQTDKRYVSNFKDGAWDEGTLTDDANIVLNECAGVFQYAQTVFEGLKAYTTEDGHIVTFRPDLNASRLADSARRLEMPVFPEERFVDAVQKVVEANAAYVPPYGSGATLYIRPYMMGTNPVIGVKPADEYQFRMFCTPVGPYFKGGAKPITIRVSDFDRAAPCGTGNIKAGLNYAMSLHAIVTAHADGFDENMYLDPKTRTKVEETGGANVIFIKGNTFVTPKSGSILPSVTRRSLEVVAKEYLESHEDAVCIVSGGQGSDEEISEADCMYNWLVSQGIAADRIYKEDKSTSTLENIKLSTEILERENLGNNVAIATNEFHIFRAGQVAEKNGLSYSAVPAKTDWWLYPTYSVREIYGVLATTFFAS